MKSLRFWILFLHLCVPCSVARAANEPMAEALFRQGRDAYDAGNLAEACEKFAESHRLDPAVGTRFNWALCEKERGMVAHAWSLFRHVLEDLEPNDPRREHVARFLLEIEPLVPRVTLELRSDGPIEPERISLFLDGERIGHTVLGNSLPVDPGTHVFVAQRGETKEQVEFSLLAGDEQQVLLTLSVIPPPKVRSPIQPATLERAPEVETKDSPRARSRAAAWLLVGTGGASIVASAVFAGLMLAAHATNEEHCDESGCDRTGQRAAKRGRAYSAAATATFAAGASLAVAGAVWLWVAPTTRVSGLQIQVQGHF